MNIRWPWASQEERDEELWRLGRMQAQARGMRQAAERDGITRDAWHPGPVTSARQVRKTERAVVARQEKTGSDARRAVVLSRAMDQALTRDRTGHPGRTR